LADILARWGIVLSAPVDVTADSPQLWQHHRTPDRIAHEYPYGFPELHHRTAPQAMPTLNPSFQVEVVRSDDQDRRLLGVSRR
jgi:hypothetical protein